MDGDPAAIAVENARRKAMAIASGPAAETDAGDAGARGDWHVLGVDTIVVIEGEVHGKPADAAHARQTLATLAGRHHDVLSGICVVEPGGEPRTALARTRVSFRPLDAETLDWYVATGEWEGRAGGYAIQGRGAALVAGIDGDYLNVVGLPVAAFLELLPAILRESS